MTNKIMFPLNSSFLLGYNYIKIAINLLMSLIRNEGE